MDIDSMSDEELEAFDRDRESGAGVLARVEAFLKRFVAYPSEHARVAHTLWCAHAHMMDCWESTARIAFLSQERGSGKTRALECSEALVPNPILSVSCTPAYIFRKIGDDESGPPTLLYDEIDNLFSGNMEGASDVLAVLNAGHRRGATAGRCVMSGKSVRTEELPAYCAVALAGLRDLPDTLASRSVLIQMRRRAPDETVEPFRRRLHAGEGERIRDDLAAWCAEVADSVTAALPDMPAGVVDRDADVWEPLLAVADAAGGDWPERARTAAVALVAGAAEQTVTPGIQLLSDLRDVFGNADKFATETILERLHNLPESPWADLRGKPLNDRGLATRLKKYGIKPKKIRTGETTARGYLAADLQDAWKRYLPPSPEKAEQAEQAEQAENVEQISHWKTTNVPDVPDVPLSGGMGGAVPDNAEQDAFEETAAKYEYEAGLPREEAEQRAADDLAIPAFLDRRASR